MSLPGGQSFALYIIFKDKNKGQWYSRDRKSSKSKVKDPVKGLEGLVAMAHKHESAAENIDIYDHREGTPKNGLLIFRWNRGKILVNHIA